MTTPQPGTPDTSSAGDQTPQPGVTAPNAPPPAPPGQVPPQAQTPGQVPPQAAPPGQIPPQAQPPGQAPPTQAQPNQVPHQPAPPVQVPPGQVPPGAPFRPAPPFGPPLPTVPHPAMAHQPMPYRPMPAPKPRRWPGPAQRPAPGAVVAVVAAAALGALAIPLDRSGLGWLLAAVAAVVAVAVAGGAPSPATVPGASSGPSTPASPLSPARAVSWYAWAAATVALLAVGMVRAAGWLFLLCLLTSLLTAVLAVHSGRSVRALGFGIGTSPVAALRGLAWLWRGAAAMRRRRGEAPRTRLAAPLGIAAALLLVFGALFASADAAFAKLLSEVVPDLNFWTVVRWLVLLPVIAAMLAAGAFLRAAPPRTSDLDEPRYHPARRFEWMIPLIALDLLFAAFVLVQSTVLFGGERHVLATAGLTYAQYARAGFWQLLVVTGLTLLVLAGAVRWAPRAEPGDRRVVRVLLGVLAGLTLVIVASALYRMIVYADAYGLTRLRILVFACELWLGTIFVMVLVAGIRLRAAWLPRAVVAAAVVALLGLAAVNPDRAIAAYNLDHDKVDVWYLRGLSADAVPAMDQAPDQLRACLLTRNAEGLDRRPDDWRGFNLAREQARGILAARPVAFGVTTCLQRRPGER